MKPTKFIPNILTICNFAGGFIAILFTWRGHFEWAAWSIVVAVICDGLDGFVARKHGGESEFGSQLDSLGDLLSSAMAPALLIQAGVLQQFQWAFAPFVFVLCGAFRLARFNAADRKMEVRGYLGLPLPVAGMSLAAWILFDLKFHWHLWREFTIFLILALALLMIGRIPFKWPRLNWKNGLWQSGLSIGKLVLTALFFLWASKAMFPVLIIYTGWGVTAFIIHRMKT